MVLVPTLRRNSSFRQRSGKDNVWCAGPMRCRHAIVSSKPCPGNISTERATITSVPVGTSLSASRWLDLGAGKRCGPGGGHGNHLHAVNASGQYRCRCLAHGISSLPPITITAGRWERTVAGRRDNHWIR